MRVRSISLVALAAVAAGLSLTACDSNASNGAAGSPSSSVSAAAGGSTTGGSTGGGGTQAPSDAGTAGTGQNAAADGTTTGGTGNGSVQAAGGTTCQTAHLSFSSSHGMGEGELVIDLKNVGAHACTMHGFPGVDLRGPGGTVSAERSKLAAPHVTLQPGQETHFMLYYPANTSGGSGVTFTSVVVTPPNETHSHTMDLSVNVPTASSATDPVAVDPVGAGK